MKIIKRIKMFMEDIKNCPAILFYLLFALSGVALFICYIYAIVTADIPTWMKWVLLSR